MAKRKNNGRNMEGKRVEIDEKELAKYANSYIGTFEILSKQGGKQLMQ